MKSRMSFLVGLLSGILILTGCRQPASVANNDAKPATNKAKALPNEGFKAEVTLPDPLPGAVQ